METITIPLVFLAGVVSFASPCFLPIVPVFMASLLGVDVSGSETQTKIPALAAAQGAGEGFLVPTGAGDAGQRAENVAGAVALNTGPAPKPPATVRSALANSVAFVVGFTLVFVLFWFAMATLGFAVGGFKTWLRVGGGALLIVLGLYMAGLLSVPALDRAWGAKTVAGDVGLRRSAIMGVAFGAGWSPCIGPVLGAVIGLALTSGTMVKGLGLMLVYSAGLALPFILLAGGATGLLGRLSWFTKHARAVKVASGVLLMVVGFLMITDLLAPLMGASWTSL
mgnify:FL=1